MANLPVTNPPTGIDFILTISGKTIQGRVVNLSGIGLDQIRIDDFWVP